MTSLQLYFDKPADWRNWLRQNHSKEITVWLEFYKKQSEHLSMNYEDAINEALCFGWIDSIIKNIDDEKYVRKFTPRKNGSKWSELNKHRAERLIKSKKMTGAGLSKIKYAKENGRWYLNDCPGNNFSIPAEFSSALNKNRKAKTNFENLSRSYQKQYITWIASAKLTETRIKRVTESIRLLYAGKKLGLK